MNGIYAPLFQSAQEAVALSNSLTHADTALLNGHEVIHWSHYVLVGTCTVAVVTAVASAILTQWPLVIACAVMGASSGLGAYYIKELSITDTLAEVIRKMVIAIQDLYRGVQELYSQIKDLKNAKTDLQKTVDKYSKIVESGSADLSSQAAKLQKVTNELKESEQKFSELKALYDPLKQTVDTFISSSGKLLDGFKDFKGAGVELSHSVDHLGKLEKEFDSEVDELGVNAQKMSDENKLALSYIQKLTQTVTFFQKVYPQLVKENELQQSELAQLKATHTEQMQTVADLKEVITRYETTTIPVIKQLMATMPAETLKALNDRLEEVKRM